MSMSYVLGRYVNGDSAALERLDEKQYQTAVGAIGKSLTSKVVGVPVAIDDVTLENAVESVKAAAPDVNAALEAIRKAIVLVGEANEGDGNSAVNEDFGELTGATADSRGNLYLFSEQRHTLWKIDQAGVVHSLVVKGNWGFPDQGITGIPLLINTGVVVDSHGSILISDYWANRILSISPDGVVTTICGTGISGYSNDGTNAVKSKINHPTGLILVDDKVIFSDSGNHKLRIIQDGNIYDYCGSGVAGVRAMGGKFNEISLNTPEGISLSSDGRIVLSDVGTHSVYISNLSRDAIDEFVEDDVHLESPIDSVLVDGNIYILDPDMHSLYRCPLSNIDNWSEYRMAETTYYGIQSANNIFLDGNNFFLNMNGNIFQRDPSGVFQYKYGRLHQDLKSSIQNADSLVVGDKGQVYIADFEGSLIFNYTPDLGLQSYAGVGNRTRDKLTLEGNATAVDINQVNSLAFNKKTKSVAFSSVELRWIIRGISSQGNVQIILDFSNRESMGSDLQQQLDNGAGIQIGGLAYDENNDLLISTGLGLVKIYGDGKAHFVPNHAQHPSLRALCADSNGLICGVDPVLHRIVRYRNSSFEDVVDPKIINEKINLSTIEYMRISKSGDIYLGDDDRIYVLDSSGKFFVLVGKGGDFYAGNTSDDNISQLRGFDFGVEGDLYVLTQQELKLIAKGELEQVLNR